MSRIIVKNLPKSITEDQLRRIFGEKGLLTDVQLKFTADGRFRQFAFLGFQDEKEAQDAISFFHNSFIQTSRISVEPCASLGDNKETKSWSKRPNDASVNQKQNLEIANDKHKVEKQNKKKSTEDTKTAELLEQYKDDPKFEEFIQIHAPKELQRLAASKSANNKDIEEEEKNAADDDQKLESDAYSENEDSNDASDKPAHQQISDLEYMKTLIKSDRKRQKTEKKIKEKVKLFTLKLRDLPYTCRKKDIKHFFSPNTPFSIRVPRGIKGIAYVGFKTEKQFIKALLKDRSFISGKRISVAKYNSSEVYDCNEQEENPKKKKWKNQEESLKNEEDIAESGRIFVRNLAYTTNENDIQELFSKFGPLTEVNLPIDTSSRKFKGFGVVTFLMPEHAVKAYSELDGTILHGRMLHLLPGIAKDSHDTDKETSNYKQKKAKKQKEQAGLSHNWNSLFLGHDAVADVIANTYGTTKRDVLDPHGNSSAAVRLALGETQIVASTRKYLEEEGVILDAFSVPTARRSKTIIMVKNLPANVQAKEIQSIFEAHGILGRVVLPPSGITAIVEFVEPSEARKAFTKLAYTKFRNLPLYLEWAPENSLSPTKKGSVKENVDKNEYNESNVEIQEIAQLDKKAAESTDTTEAEEIEQEPESDTTLFVKNLNFETTDDGLYKHFEQCGKIHYATVAMKKDKSQPGKMLSMGYGFVRFMHKSSADKALKTLQQSQLDGKSLELKRSERTLRNEVTTARKTVQKTKQMGTKILVRNVPFQANKKEVMELFRAFGEIKALRIPKKMTIGADSHRGFAFIDYVAAADAKKAFEALSQSTHLYGRRLVLEWAATDDGVEQIRKRTAEHFHPPEDIKSKKSVFSLEKV